MWMKETWKIIEDFPDYLISDSGLVMSRITDHVKVPSVNQQGIAHVLLVKDGHQYRRSVAVMVAKAFLAAPEAPHFDTPVNIDGDRLNNAVENLCWRPRWFAIKYHQQMREGSRSWSDDPVYDLKTRTIYKSMWDAATTLVLLEKDVFMGTVNWTPVFPGGYHFRFLEE